MPLRNGGGHDPEIVLAPTDDRNFGHDPTTAVCEIAKVHAACFWQGPCNLATQPFSSTNARKRVA